MSLPLRSHQALALWDVINSARTWNPEKWCHKPIVERRERDSTEVLHVCPSVGCVCVWVQLAAGMGQQASCWERSLQEKEPVGHHEVILTWARFYAAAIYLEPREEKPCVCVRLFLYGCVHANACLCACACVCVDRARRWRVMANFEAATRFWQRCLSNIHLCVWSQKAMWGSRQIAFTPVNMTLEA